MGRGGLDNHQGGLKVRAELDKNLYPKGRKVTNDEMTTLNIQRDLFHNE